MSDRWWVEGRLAAARWGLIIFGELMPPPNSPNGPLTDAEMATISDWLRNGAPNN